MGYRGLGRDITAVKRAEAQLRVSEERLRLALDATRDGLWDYDLRTGHVYRSPRYYEITGYAAHDVAADFEFFKRLVHPDDLPFVVQSIDAHRLIPLSLLEFEFRMITRSGDIRWMHVRGRAVQRDAAGLALRMTGTLTDINTSKTDEAARLQQAAELAKRNDELERFNRVTVGRELDMIALKRQVNELSRALGREPPFRLAFCEASDSQTVDSAS
jgi:PAS domain S-box-containing protein